MAGKDQAQWIRSFRAREVSALAGALACAWSNPANADVFCLVFVDGGAQAESISEIRPEEEKPRFVGAENGLFRIEGTSLVPVDGGAQAGVIFEIRSEEEKPRFVIAENGLFQFIPRALPQVLNRSKKTSKIFSGEPAALIWEVKSGCLSVTNGSWRLKLGGGSPRLHPPTSVAKEGSKRLVTAQVPIEANDGDTVTAVLQFRWDEGGDWVDVEGSQRTLAVNWTAVDYIALWARQYGGWLALAHAVLFFALLFAARYSARAWNILSDPALNKSFLWFWFAMRHLPILHRLVLSRWFDDVSTKIDAVPHVPLPLTRPKNTELSSVDIRSEIRPRRRIWIQGNTGMGKTALANHLTERWFTDHSMRARMPPSLNEAFRAFGYVMVPISLRDYAVVPRTEPPEIWIFELIERQLARGQLPVKDRRLLESFLTSGSVVLVLDGANEVDDGGAIQQFALRYPRVGLLVTSQTLPDTDAANTFEVWSLPSTIDAAVSPLLHAWLEKDRADAVAEAVAHSPISNDIRSGYDVRLLADLQEGSTDAVAIPETRMGLYEAMLSRVIAPSGNAYPSADLCQTTWQAWAEGRRQLERGTSIPGALLDPLLATGVRIVRHIGDDAYEFRHDQMRGYLAARWAAVHQVSPLDLLKSTEGIWRLGRSEQETVWEFLAELISPELGIPLLAWSTLAAERSELQVALRRVANRDDW